MPRAVPVQARAKARYDSIVAAARAHYAEVGHDEFNLDAVADAAGCSVATIYRYFDDRVALLDVIAPERNTAERKLAEIEAVAAETGLQDYERWWKVEEIIREDS